MKFTKYILFFSVAGLLFLSCNSDSTGPSTGFQILPLAVGNYWNYESYLVRDNIVVSDSFINQMSIISLDTVKSFIGYKLINFLMWSWRSTYCSSRGDGLHIAVDPDENPPSPPPLPRPLITGKGLSFPTYPGDSWNFDVYQIRTTKLNESISVPAGVFNCIAYQILEADTLVAELWVTQNIGIIKGIQKNNTGELRINNLVTYALAK